MWQERMQASCCVPSMVPAAIGRRAGAAVPPLAGVRWIPDWTVGAGTDPALPHRPFLTLVASAAVCFLTSHFLPTHLRGLCWSLSE